MIDFGVWQGRLGPAVRPPHGNQAGLRRKRTIGLRQQTAAKGAGGDIETPELEGDEGKLNSSVGFP